MKKHVPKCSRIPGRLVGCCGWFALPRHKCCAAHHAWSKAVIFKRLATVPGFIPAHCPPCGSRECSAPMELPGSSQSLRGGRRPLARRRPNPWKLCHSEQTSQILFAVRLSQTIPHASRPSHLSRLSHKPTPSTTTMAASTSPLPPNTHETSVPELALNNEGLEAKPEPTAVEGDYAKSIATRTTYVFCPFVSESTSRRPHNLGLNINSYHGWNGSQYNDYE